ncbi:PLEK2 protein, partial [Polyodon spathula]|nr:PLEK2 protein [Polyodon spathula]
MDTIQDENAVLKEGFLVKRGHIVHNWKARWFVLHTDRLLYYRYEGGKRESYPRGKVILAECKVTCPCLEYENRPVDQDVLGSPRTSDRCSLASRLRAFLSESCVVLRRCSSLVAAWRIRKYFLEACSREQRDSWASSITAAIQTLHPSQAPKPDPEHSPIQLNNISLNQVVDSMHDAHSGIKLMNHIEQGSSFKQCFTGSALVDWLVSLNFVMTRFEAVTLSSALMDESFVKPIGIKSIEAIRSGGLSDQFLDDSTALYTFMERCKRKASMKHEISLSAVELSGRVVIQAYLLKQGHNRKSWKVRLFVLRAEPGYLHYYDPSRDDHRPVGGFPLRGCLVSALEDNGVHSGVKGKLQGNLFKIITQNDIHYYIQATSKEERLEWINTLKQLTC